MLKQSNVPFALNICPFARLHPKEVCQIFYFAWQVVKFCIQEVPVLRLPIFKWKDSRKRGLVEKSWVCPLMENTTQIPYLKNLLNFEKK